LVKKIFVPVIKILVSVVLIIFLLTRLGVAEIIDQLTAANPWWIVAGVVAFSLSNLLGSLQWYLLMKTQGIDISLSQALSYYWVGLFFNNFLIGYVGGDAIRIYDISRVSGNSSHAISTFFFDRLTGFVILTPLALVAGLVWRNMFHSSSIVFVIVVIFACWVISFIVLFNENFARRIGWVFRFILTARVNDKIREVYSSINSFKHEKKTIITVLFISLLTQSLRIVVHYFAALSIGLNAHIKYFFIFVPVIALLASLPISIGGIGIREGTGVALFSRVNSFQPEAIVAMEFLAYVIGLLSAIPGGLIFMFRKEEIGN